jgi:sortase B
MYKKNENRDGRNKKHAAVLGLAVVLLAAISVVSGMLVTRMRDFDASEREYSQLRELSRTMGTASTAGASAASPTVAPETKAEALTLINPDYIGWLNIAGTKVDYPVAQGADNDKYMSTSFSGEPNENGAIFMDYRCNSADVPHLIIYGHNIRQGRMFGDLKKLLDSEYLASHPVITLEQNGHAAEYRIFSARTTDINDPAYRLDFTGEVSFETFARECGAPEGTARIITLSTCVSAGNDDERVVVQGMLRQ